MKSKKIFMKPEINSKHKFISHNQAGFTQVELMISVAIMSIFFLALVGGFGPLIKGLFVSKAKTLGMNLAQEKIEKTKALSYYRTMVTATPQVYPGTSFSYDDNYYPPETLMAGGITFRRLTYIEVAQEVSGAINTLSPTTPDTGMKLVTVTVLWGSSADNEYVVLKNLVSNPNMITSNATILGTITDAATGAPIDGALVNIAENTGWVYITGSNGQYTLNVLPGSYNIVASMQGYFTKTYLKSVSGNQTVSQGFALSPMASGIISGSVWLNDHPVISQVVGSSVCVATGFIQEYVELFNPTTTQILMRAAGAPQVDLVYQSEDDLISRILMLDYYTDAIPPLGYYLIANTTTLTVAGSTITADASFIVADPEYPDVIKDPKAGGFGIAPTGTTAWYDRFGWDRNSGSKNAPIYETEGLDEHIGLEVGEQYVRLTSTAGVTNGNGNCYDSGNNNIDFIRGTSGGTFYPPHNSDDTAVIKAGVPVSGAAITMDDNLSAGTISYLSGGAGTPRPAVFSLISVATGTWNAIVCGNDYLLQISTIVVTNGTTTYIPNTTTSPASTIGPKVFLTDPAEQGYISGRVTNAAGAPIISPNIDVTDGFNTRTANDQGYYLMQTSPSTYTVTANQNASNPLYTSQSQTDVVVRVGQITSNVNFRLSQGGKIRGFATRDGVNPLPDILFIAEDSNGASKAEEVSGSNGYFSLVNLSTGTYDVYPILDSGEQYTATVASPYNLSTAGSTLFCSTFTITGAFGKVVGTVTESGQPIATGVLIVISTGTFSGSPPNPPAISSATLTSGALYMGSSGEDGAYSVEVRGSTSTAYNVYAFYPKMTGSQITLKYKVESSQFVTAGSTKTVNFSTWLP